jgi:hypothetical protein
MTIKNVVERLLAAQRSGDRAEMDRIRKQMSDSDVSDALDLLTGELGKRLMTEINEERT